MQIAEQKKVIAVAIIKPSPTVGPRPVSMAYAIPNQQTNEVKVKVRLATAQRVRFLRISVSKRCGSDCSDPLGLSKAEAMLLGEAVNRLALPLALHHHVMCLTSTVSHCDELNGVSAVLCTKTIQLFIHGICPLES